MELRPALRARCSTTAMASSTPSLRRPSMKPSPGGPGLLFFWTAVAVLWRQRTGALLLSRMAASDARNK
eukprot:8150404-Pyramimonas_sp.AAC.1